MNISSYIYGTSFYHKLDVRAKLIFTLLYAVVTFFMSSYTGLAAVFFIPLLIMLIAVGGKETIHCYSRLLPLFLIMCFFIPLQERTGTPLWVIRGFTVATREGLWTVLRIISRLGSVSGILMLLLLTQRNEEIIKGLRAFHLPYNAALASSMILRFIPYLGTLFAEIRSSMSLRLKEGKRGYPILPSITALIIAAVKMVPETAAALEERGFGREKMKSVHMKRPRYYFVQCLLCIIIPLSLLFLR